MKYFPELEPCFVGRDSELAKLELATLAEQSRGIQVIGMGGEGKTTLVQYFVHNRSRVLAQAGYELVLGFSFYRADVGRFISDSCVVLGLGSSLVSIPERIAALCGELEKRRILIVLDGLELYQGPDGSITNPHLSRVLKAASSGASLPVVTSRVPCTGNLEILDLGPLADSDSMAILEGLGSERRLVSKEIDYWMRRKAGNHALTVRILSGLLYQEPKIGVRLLRDLRVTELPDDADPLTANKIARVLASYMERLPLESTDLMRCVSLFSGPVPLSAALDCFSSDLGTSSPNASLVGRDVRPYIRSLVDRRLLVLEGTSHLTAHPTIREFFQHQTSSDEAVSFHRLISEYLLRFLPPGNPESFEDAEQYFELCYQAAKGRRWRLFHTLFHGRLNRGYLDYLVDNLGAWQEYLDMAKLTFLEEDFSQPALIPEHRIYYLAGAARAHKHLGLGAEALQLYRSCLAMCAESQEVNTAMYVNNCFTLVLQMARLDLAKTLMELNSGVLHWISEDWKRYWQKEHGFYPFGRFAALRGDFDAAEEYCSYARDVWSSYPGERVWIFDFDRIYHADVLMAKDPGRFAEALELTNFDLNLAQQNGWLESEARAHRCLASTYRQIIGLADNPDFYKDLVVRHLEAAESIADRLLVPALELEILAERANFVGDPGTDQAGKDDQLRWIHQRMDELISWTDLRLYEVDLHVVRANHLLLQDDRLGAARSIATAIRVAKAYGVLWPLVAAHSSLRTTAERAGAPVPPAESFRVDRFPAVAEVLSLRLSPEEFILRLEAASPHFN